MHLDLPFDAERFVSVLRDLVAHSERLQNNPPELVPRESLAGDVVLRELEPWSTTQGGPLEIEEVAYVAGRSNVMVRYPGRGAKTVAFVGAHLDVVPANPDEWQRPPFRLTVEGDRLYGRGVTDCLGHCALLVELFRELARARPALERSVHGVFIANEENSSIRGIGVDEMGRRGKLDVLAAGPVIWVDSADVHPTIGTGSMAAWQLTVSGKIAHSGLPQDGINAIELASAAVAHLQRRFYERFPAHEQEERYEFPAPSSMKPTRWQVPPGSVNQIPGECVVRGDIRVTPFYRLADVQRFLEEEVRALDVTSLPSQGPSRYALQDGARGSLRIEWVGDPMEGIACDLASEGYRALSSAVEKVRGSCKPFSFTGSLPLVKELQDRGFDLQVIGFGRRDTYHAPNEFGQLSDFADGLKIMCKVVEALEG
jgi:acetylornithine deacetylase